MSEKAVSFNAFPANRNEFLTMLYLQSQDLTGKTPEELATLYHSAYEKIDSQFSELRKAAKKERRTQQNYWG